MTDSSAAAAAGQTRGSRNSLVMGRSRDKLTSSVQNLADPVAAAASAKRLLTIPGSASVQADVATSVHASADQSQPVPQRTLENTFKTTPDSRFPTEQVRRLAEEIVDKRLKGVVYNVDKAVELTKLLSAEVLTAVKKLPLERYKYVVDVSIGEFKGQGIRVASRALWDASTDSYTSISFKNATLFCVVMVFGAYFE